MLLATSICKGQADALFPYEPPEFTGGRNAFYSYIDQYIDYPINQYQYGIEGGLSAVINISKDGKVKFVNVLGGNADFREEIKRIMTLMPNWQSGKLNGTAIDTFVIQRFVFSQDSPKFLKDTITYELTCYWEPYTDAEIQANEIRQNKREFQKKIWQPIYKKAVKETINGNYLAAIDLFKESKRKGNNTAVLYYDLSVAYYNSGDFSNSCDCLREAALRKHALAFKEYLKSCK